MFVGGRERSLRTRSEKRRIRQDFREQNGQGEEPDRSSLELHPLDFSTTHLKVLQEEDPTLHDVRTKVRGPPPEAGPRFFEEEGLIYRHWVPPGRDDEDMAVDQLVYRLNVVRKC